MQAFSISRYGPTEVLQQVTLPVPAPGPQEVLIKVHCVAINDWDWGLMRGSPMYMRLMVGLFTPKIRVAGTDIAGVVDTVGDRVTQFQPGDAVYGDLSDCGFGGFAEYVSAKASSLVLKPPAMSFAEAAAMAHAGMLAEQGLFEIGELRAGQRLLINGAGGGVGTLALQMAKPLGVEVAGVDHGDKLAMMQQIGFDHLVDYTVEDFTRSGLRYDLILDTRTTRSPFSYLRALNPGGQYVTVGGATSGLLGTFALGPLIRRVTGKTRAGTGFKTEPESVRAECAL